MLTTTPTAEFIQRRYSCRHYLKQPMQEYHINKLKDFIEALSPGPFDSHIRFNLIAATIEDYKALRGFGTYGFIKNASAFIIGASNSSDYHLEDYGYLLERIILYATSLGLGTCWLGGTFSKSSFAKQIELRHDEQMPAVAAIGEIADPNQKRQGLVSLIARAQERLPWKDLFFNYSTGVPLLPNEAGEYITPLEMVRLAPSASNKQPWRVISSNDSWHFYLQRTPGYRGDPIKQILRLCDLQRVDMGIAMCHFQLTTQELGLSGRWFIEKSLTQIPHPLGEYLVSWKNNYFCPPKIQ